MERVFHFERQGVSYNIRVRIVHKRGGYPQVTFGVVNSKIKSLFYTEQDLYKLEKFFGGDPAFDTIFRMWKRYKSDLHPECEHQEELGWPEIGRQTVCRHRFRLTGETCLARSELKRKIIDFAKDGAPYYTTGEERKLLSLLYYVETYDEKLPDDIRNYYELNSENRVYLSYLTPEEHTSGLLGKPCPVCGYKYGTSFRKVYVTKEDDAVITRLIKEGE